MYATGPARGPAPSLSARRSRPSRPMQSRYLLVTPCDPGNCHIYFGVQLRAFPTALALAKSLKRTLVLPPFEWYENQVRAGCTSTLQLCALKRTARVSLAWAGTGICQRLSCHGGREAAALRSLVRSI